MKNIKLLIVLCLGFFVNISAVSTAKLKLDIKRNNILYKACKDGDLSKVKEVVGASSVNLIDKYTRTPLIMAAYCGSMKIVKWLVENGADVNKKGSPFYHCYKNIAPMEAAALGGHFKVLKFLKSNGADINIDKVYPIVSDGGRCLLAMMIRANKCKLAMIKYYVEILGCNVNKISSTTPLCRAVKYDKYDIAKYLIEKGADVNVKGKSKVIGILKPQSDKMSKLLFGGYG